MSNSTTSNLGTKLPEDGEVLSLAEEHTVGQWIVATWSNGLKTVSPTDSERFISGSRRVEVETNES